MSIPLQIISYKIPKARKKLFSKLSLKAYTKLPSSVKINLQRLSGAGRRAKIVAYSNKKDFLEMKEQFLVRTPLKLVKKVMGQDLNGVYFNADNVIFVDITSSQHLEYIINHEFGHLVDHHNLHHHKDKWKKLITNIMCGKVTRKQITEMFADAYAMYVIGKEELKPSIKEFFKNQVFKGE